MLKEFKEFLLKQNALALAVAVIIGAAVSKVVSGIVDDLVMPIIGVVLPGGEWRAAQLTLSGSNAIKYGIDGSEVLLRVTSQDHKVTFEVRNSGPAIPAAELEHIFERFYRPTRSESIPGWGLGLSFVRRICQQHGGRVHVSSNEISGTSFAFTLPRGASNVLEVAP